MHLSSHNAPIRAVALLFIAMLLNLMDRQAVAVLLEPIRREFGLSDTQLGILSGTAFALFYAPLALPMGYVADIVRRPRLLALAMACWSVASAACGFATGFLQLALSRMAVAIGEAAAVPVSHGLLADLFPPTRRSLAISIVQAGAPVGVILAFVAGGQISVAFGWRAAFWLTAVPGLLLAAIIVFALPEPRRAPAAASPAPHGSLVAAVRRVVKQPAYLPLILAAAGSAICINAALAWLAAYTQRTFHMTEASAGLIVGPLAGGLGIVGTIAGGWLGDQVQRRRRDGNVLVTAVAMAIGAMAFALFLLSDSLVPALIALAPASAALSVFQGCLAAAVQNQTPPDDRGVAAGTLTLATNLLGLGVGPALVGFVSDMAAANATGNLRAGLGVVPAIALATCLALLFAASRIHRAASMN